MTNAIYEPDKADIQGLILRGYTHPYSCHMLFKFGAALPAGQGFFRALYPLVQNAEDWDRHKPQRLLNLGLTYPGLQQLGPLSPDELAIFPADFSAGPWNWQSQSSLGDYDASAPAAWWNKHFAPEDVHCVVHAYALTQPDLDALVALVATVATANGVQELLPLAGPQPRLVQGQLPNEEVHFGYRDGISEPALTRSPAAPPATPNQGDLANFLIGYGPLNGSLIQPGPAGPATGKAGTFAKNGCYNAFRVLHQDVAAFNALLAEQAQQVAPLIGRPVAETQEWLAAKLMGRWRNGSPLMLSPDQPSGDTWSGEAFGYVQPAGAQPADPSPYRDVFSTGQCPFSAHTRVVNPRDEQMTANEGGLPPRLVRRGAPYGPPLATTADDGVDRGLIGLFLCGSLSRQFEKIYGWINTNDFAQDFNAYPTPQDAVMGNRNPTKQGNIGTGFSIPGATLQPKEAITIPKLPLLIQTRGTAYCLLPSLTTLRGLAGL